MSQVKGLKPYEKGLFVVFLCGFFFTAGAWLQRSELEHELGALQAQTEKTHCAGEVTYPEMVGEVGK